MPTGITLTIPETHLCWFAFTFQDRKQYARSRIHEWWTAFDGNRIPSLEIRSREIFTL